MFLVIEVGHMVGIYAGELRLTVYHHKCGAGLVAAYAAHLDMACSAVAYAEPEYAALCHEQAGDLSGDGGQQLCLSGGLQFFFADY